jgi:Domain of unknown function (DUF6398)
MDSVPAWWVLRRDVSASVRVEGVPSVFATLIVDSGGEIAGLHAGPDAGASLRTAMRGAVQRPRRRRPAMVLCEPDLGREIQEALSEVGLRVPLSPEEPPDEILDAYDQVLAHMTGRKLSADPPTPAGWRALHAQALRYVRAEPWKRWPDTTDVPLRLKRGGRASRVHVALLSEGDVRRAFAVSRRPHPPDGAAPESTLLVLESEDVPPEATARAERYGWPAGEPLKPTFVTLEGISPREVSAAEADLLTAAIVALLEHEPSDSTDATESVESALASLRVPAASRGEAVEVATLTDSFCAEHLDAEYGRLCREAVARLARKRPSPLTRGELHIWAAAVVYTVGSINFLFDSSQRPHLRGDQISELTGVPRSTLTSKSRRIRDLLGLRQWDPGLCRQEVLRNHPYAWMVEVDGLIVDARTLPPAMQAEAARRGLIPDR